MVTTRSAKWVGTSSTTRSSPGKAITHHLAQPRARRARCSRPWTARRLPSTRGEPTSGSRQRRRPVPASIAPFVARTPPGVRADLGCGPGWYSEHLRTGKRGEPVVALDAAQAMLQRVPEFAPDALPVQADLELPPVPAGRARGRVGAQVLHARGRDGVPLALAELHRAVALGGAVHLQRLVRPGARGRMTIRSAGVCSRTSRPSEFRELVEGAGFEVSRRATTARSGSTSKRRARCGCPTRWGPTCVCSWSV